MDSYEPMTYEAMELVFTAAEENLLRWREALLGWKRLTTLEDLYYFRPLDQLQHNFEKCQQQEYQARILKLNQEIYNSRKWLLFQERARDYKWILLMQMAISIALILGGIALIIATSGMEGWEFLSIGGQALYTYLLAGTFISAIFVAASYSSALFGGNFKGIDVMTHPATQLFMAAAFLTTGALFIAMGGGIPLGSIALAYGVQCVERTIIQAVRYVITKRYVHAFERNEALSKFNKTRANVELITNVFLGLGLIGLGVVCVLGGGLPLGLVAIAVGLKMLVLDSALTNRCSLWWKSSKDKGDNEIGDTAVVAAGYHSTETGDDNSSDSYNIESDDDTRSEMSFES